MSPPAVGEGSPHRPAVCTDPCLSVLIPAFNQPAGLERALHGLAALKSRSDLEILVSDDSTDDAAAACIAQTCFAFGGVKYRRNQPSLGAVANWNSLLDQACGRYCWLLHHDEEIDSATDLPRLLDTLAIGAAPDAWLLACRVVGSPGRPGVLHFPAAWAARVTAHWPSYLLRRNLIGSPSALIVRRQCYQHFDPRLQWRVDVDAYVRMLYDGLQLQAWPMGGLISHRDRENSITAKLASRLRDVEASEHRLLCAAYASRPTARWLFSTEGLAPLWRAVEALAWSLFRAAYRGVQALAARLNWSSGGRR